MEQIPSTENTEAQAARPGRKRYADVPLAEKLAVITAWLEEHKAERIVSLNLTEQGGFADALLVLTAGSMRHAQSLADGVAALCHERNYEYLRVEGYEASGSLWICTTSSSTFFWSPCGSCTVWRPSGASLRPAPPTMRLRRPDPGGRPRHDPHPAADS